jgi:hypothetical protein
MPDPHEAELADLSVLVLGRLSDREAQAVRQHLSGCEICLGELPALQQGAGLLAAAEAEAFLEGPPLDADLLIRRTVRAIREQDGPSAQPADRSSAQRGRRRSGPVPVSRSPRLIAAAAALLVAAGAGVIGGRLSAPTETVAGPGVTATPTTVPGTKTAAHTDPRTGARLSVQVVPASGWVKITAATAGISQGQKCRLVVIDRAGTRAEAGSWIVSAKGAAQGTTVQGSTIVDPAQVAAVQVENTSGKVLVTTQI